VEYANAFDVEKKRLQEQKLRKRYFDGVVAEHIKLNALRSGQFVTSFRTSYLSDTLVAALKEVRA
jgi:hypothetical protein